MVLTSSGSVSWRALDRTDAHTHVVDLAAAGVDSLEQLVHLVVAHLLAQVGENVSQLSNANVSRHLLVKDLEAPAVLLGLARIAEAAWSVEHLLKRVKVKV